MFLMCNANFNLMYRDMVKPLYGLVTASKIWYDRLKGVLTDIELTLNDNDPCFSGMFMNNLIHICCYVDDLLAIPVMTRFLMHW